MNATVSLLQGKASVPKVLRWLVAQYGISRRQAYRYLQQAQSAGGLQPVPEAKGVFTVKLSISLIQQVRQRARRERGAVGPWVESALRRALNQRPDHG